MSQNEPPAFKHSTHRVHRPGGSLPCYCEETVDHLASGIRPAVPVATAMSIIDALRAILDFEWMVDPEYDHDGERAAALKKAQTALDTHDEQVASHEQC